MDNRDFDNLFKNQLNSLPEKEFLFEENAWDDVENVLETKGILPPVKQNKFGILPFFLFGLLILSNTLVGWKYYNAEQEITVLNTTIQDLEINNRTITEINNNANDKIEPSSDDSRLAETSNHLFDNYEPKIKIVEKIVEKVVKEIVYVPVNSPLLSDNSIINNHYLPNNSSQNINNNNDLNASSNTVLSQNNSNYSTNPSDSDINKNTNNTTTQNQKNATISNTTNNQNPENTTIATTDNDNQIDVSISKNMTSLDLIELSEIDNPVQQIDEPLENIIDTTAYQYKATFKDYLARIGYATEISNYELGISSGIDAFYQPNNFNTISTRFGITSEITFSQRIKFGTTIDFKETGSELDNIAQGNYPDEYFDNYPSLGGINVYDELNKIESRYRNVEFSLFAKYIIQSHRKWSPYVGIGIKGEYDYEQRFEYKYLNNLGYEYEMDYVYMNNKQFGFNTLLGLAGIQYKLSPSINMRLDAMYNYDYKMHRFDNSKKNWFSTNFSILYKFK